MKTLNCFFRTCLVAASIISSAMLAGNALAQQDGTLVKTQDYEFRIGAAADGTNSSAQKARNFRRPSFEHVVRSDNAEWIRVNFKDVNLGSKSYIELYAPLDGASQILDAATLAESNYSSAYFNGDEVRIILHKVAGDRRAGISIDSIEVGEKDPGGVVAFSQCGPNDDRVLSNDPAVGRIMPIGCTGWLIGNRKFLTAGHCISSRTQSLHFNVPLSTSGGRYVNSAPEDQYTIIQDSIKFRDNGPGNDWAVFEVQNNSQTGLHPLEAQGRAFNLVRDTNIETIRITGHGVDDGNRNGVQQTHTGRFTSVSGTRLNYKVDTEGGNSGSPVIDEDTGNAIGIHTHGGCRTDGSGANSGTSTLNSAFWAEADPGVTPTDPDKVGITAVQPTRTTTANRRAMPFIMPASGSLSSITMYHSGGSGKMQLAVYGDNNGLPGALLAASPEVETSSNTGWQTVQLRNAASASEGQRIWLAWVYENNPGIFYDTGTPGRANINQTWSDGANNMPNSFGASTIADYRYSIYATFATDGGTANVGIETVGSQTSVNGSRRAMPFNMPDDGQIESISIYHEGGSGGLVLAAYADNNGAPGSLLATSGVVGVSAASGWQSVSLSSVTPTINSGQRVWLGWVFENNPGVRYVSGSPGRAQSDQSWGGGMPNNFGASGQADFRYSIYATYKKQ